MTLNVSVFIIQGVIAAAFIFVLILVTKKWPLPVIRDMVAKDEKKEKKKHIAVDGKVMAKRTSAKVSRNLALIIGISGVATSVWIQSYDVAGFSTVFGNTIGQFVLLWASIVSGLYLATGY